jgi:hypothetical protein
MFMFTNTNFHAFLKMLLYVKRNAMRAKRMFTCIKMQMRAQRLWSQAPVNSVFKKDIFNYVHPLSHGRREMFHVHTKTGNLVGFDRVDLSQTHTRLRNGQRYLPMTRPMGTNANPCPNPSGHPTLVGTHRICTKLNFLIDSTMRRRSTLVNPCGGPPLSPPEWFLALFCGPQRRQ